MYITWEQFKAMLQKPFGYLPPSQLMALLARYVVMVAGDAAVYVRPPSEEESGKIYRFTQDDVAADWFLPDHKPYYSRFLQDSTDKVKYPNYDADLVEEQERIEQVLADTRGLTVEEINEWWHDHLMKSAHSQIPVGAQFKFVPATPTQPNQITIHPDSRGDYLPELRCYTGLPGTGPPGARKRSFKFPARLCETGGISHDHPQEEAGATKSQQQAVICEPEAPEPQANEVSMKAETQAAKMVKLEPTENDAEGGLLRILHATSAASATNDHDDDLTIALRRSIITASQEGYDEAVALALHVARVDAGMSTSSRPNTAIAVNEIVDVLSSQE